MKYWDTYCFTNDVGGLGKDFDNIFLMGMNTLDCDSFQHNNMLYRGFETMSEKEIESWKNELSKFFTVEEIENHNINPTGHTDLDYVRIIKLYK